MCGLSMIRVAARSRSPVTRPSSSTPRILGAILSNSALYRALLLRDRLKRQHHCSIDQVRADGNVLDPVDGDETAAAEEHFVLIGVEPALTSAAAGREPANRIAQPIGKTGDIVERQEVLAFGRDKQVLFRPRRASLFRDSRIDQTG
jgi:hypothetical protein